MDDATNIVRIHLWHRPAADLLAIGLPPNERTRGRVKLHRDALALVLAPHAIVAVGQRDLPRRIDCPAPAPLRQVGVDPRQIEQLRLIGRLIWPAWGLQRRKRHLKRSSCAARVARWQLLASIGERLLGGGVYL